MISLTAKRNLETSLRGFSFFMEIPTAKKLELLESLRLAIAQGKYTLGSWATHRGSRSNTTFYIQIGKLKIDSQHNISIDFKTLFCLNKEDVIPFDKLLKPLWEMEEQKNRENYDRRCIDKWDIAINYIRKKIF